MPHSLHTAASVSLPEIATLFDMPAAADLRALIIELFDKGGFVLCKKGEEITLKSGILSPFYVNLRVTVSYPALLEQIAESLRTASATAPHDLLCGVPYTALPFATAMSISQGVPMVMRRKERKRYGTAKEIEGNFQAGARCLVVEDIATSGGSVLETVDDLVAAEIIVEHAVVLVDREQGARKKLAERGIQLHAVTTISEMLSVLYGAGRISAADVERVRSFVQGNQVSSVTKAPLPMPRSYTARSRDVKSPIARRLLTLMAQKRTNLAVAADVTTRDSLLCLAEDVGSEICVLKTHADIVSDWDASTGAALREIADRHNFLIFEDRKFADIGNTVMNQLKGGVHRIAEWADFVNAHALPGPGIIDGLQKACKSVDRPIGLLLLAQMSSAGNLTTLLPEYSEAVVNMAKQSPEFVFGFISMGQLSGEHADNFVYMTPGVKLAIGGDALGQQYNTPEKVIGEKGSDVIIVGRGIYEASNPRSAAAQYRAAGWQAYIKRGGADVGN